MVRVETIELGGGAASSIDTNSTGQTYDGDHRVPLPREHPPVWRRAYVVLSTNGAGQGSTQYDVHVRDYTDSSNLASVADQTSDLTGRLVELTLSDIEDGDELGIRFNVDTASGTSGSVAGISATLYLEERE